jgi:hypothetical protein
MRRTGDPEGGRVREVTRGCTNLNNEELHYCGSNQIKKEQDIKGWNKGSTYGRHYVHHSP